MRYCHQNPARYDHRCLGSTSVSSSGLPSWRKLCTKSARDHFGRLPKINSGAEARKTMDFRSARRSTVSQSADRTRRKTGLAAEDIAVCMLHGYISLIEQSSRLPQHGGKRQKLLAGMPGTPLGIHAFVMVLRSNSP